ncbi:Na/Pi cotransporter family protein [Peredibacter starrii]|uniref:Na/Pi cotransporter family protein n=1 Tax=Peredibacter starrii TaxID=28202 RepID=A0AAX4HL95_9BACT|nr:Na/Pi cotransporter family protein [Peredibacter starrii]WPU64030.1 Na/Pi cotransporter family protein [Peredibacter starrii]
MEAFTIIYTLLGGLGIFFFGMKFMSDGLQAVAGDVIRKIINSITSNRFMAVGVGLLVTCIIQSSSVTTVMTVGFVNAGLMNLTQAIGVIFGANIGTTITGWIISIKVDKYGLLLVGLGFIPGLFSKSEKWQHLGRAVLGVGLVFIGLQTMSSAFVPLRDNQAFLDSIAYFSGEHYGAYIASILMGCLLTMIVQSSSAMLGITMALATSGVIPYHTAVTLVLGENIGTTVTAILASIGATVNAKRAARAHALFNVFGVCVMLMILPYYFDIVNSLIPQDARYIAPDGSAPYVAQHIALAHTLFNLTATLLFIPFINQLAALVTKLTPDRAEKEVPHLLMLGDPSNMLPAASMAQAESEIKKMRDIVERMYKLNREFWFKDDYDPKMLAKIIDYERITDNIHKEITVFLCYVMEKPMSHHQSEQIQAMIKITDELESVADYIERLANYRDRFKSNEKLDGESRTEFFSFMDEVWVFFEMVSIGFQNSEDMDMSRIEAKSHELQLWADSMREKHLDRISKGNYLPVTALTYSDMVVALRKIRAHSLLMAGAIENFNSKHE